MSWFNFHKNKKKNIETNTTNTELETRNNSPQISAAPKPNGWTRNNLLPYCKYRKLYGERKYAQKYPDHPLRFLDLPAEIRNKIYRYVLCFGSIELSAKANDADGNKCAVKHHMSIYKYEITPRLRLLRLNKQLNTETASIFYSENEFRFSSMHGHDLLFAFCRTIGRRNTRLLRKIVEHAPWFGSYGDPTCYRDRPAHQNSTSWQNFQGIIGTMGLHEKGYGAWKFNIMRTLTRRDGGVTEYTMILPDPFLLDSMYEFDGYNKMRTLLSWMKEGSDVQITLAKLIPGDDFSHRDLETKQYQQLCRDTMVKEALKCGWRVLETTYDRRGRYDLEAPKNTADAAQIEEKDELESM